LITQVWFLDGQGTGDEGRKRRKGQKINRGREGNRLERGTEKQGQYGADQGRIENRIEYGERGRETERERRVAIGGEG
jgi:hypothetical protein